MKLICKHCDYEFEADISDEPRYGFPDCIWCPECMKLTAIKLAHRLWRGKHEGCTDIIIDWGDEE